jgi:hypothetical protein
LELRKSSKLVEAVYKVIEKALSKFSESFNLISAGRNRSFVLNDFTNKLMAKVFRGGKVKVNQKTTKRLNVWQSQKKKSTIIVCESFASLFEIVTKISLDVFMVHGRFLIVSVSGEFRELEEIFEMFWRHKIYNVNAMFEDDNEEVSVKTFMPFSKGNCGNSNPMQINKFKDGKFVNGTENFFPRKIKNMNKCEVKVAIGKGEPYVFALNNLTKKYDGIDVRVIDTLAEMLNFKVKYFYSSDGGFIYQNGSSKGPFKSLLEKESDLLISGYRLQTVRSMFFDFSMSYISDSVIFVVPPGTDLSSFEELVYPFSLFLWIAIVVCLIIGL